ncbi:MAG TPA: condensation domain-containing protein, partial [Pyrinomonadaceae bacterium]
YTSGSTGRPKGVAMIHRALCNLLHWQLRDLPLIQGPRTLQFASLNFDVSFQEIFSAWCAGGALVLISEEVRQDAERLWEVIRRHEVERLFLPYVALQHLASVCEDLPDAPTSLRRIITAGEQLKITPPVERLFGRLEGCALQNQYGPTESHVVTSHTLNGTPDSWPRLPPIGRPVANTQVYVLTGEGMQIAPAGVVGEVYIGGEALARGYLRRPGLTAERFVPNPYGREAGARLYKTGDLGRYRPDGEIEYLGRSDQQVKIRGYRIEPGEIESVLNRHEAVAESAVVVRENARGEKVLAAYVVARDGQAGRPRVEQLREHLKQALPPYMMPSVFMTLAELPLTPSGKLDRRALPPVDAEESEGENDAAPLTPVEELVAGVWAEALSLRRVGRGDNFFESGGHSLLATQVVHRLRAICEVDLSVRALFEAPTVEGLARAVETAMRAGRRISLPPIEPAPREGELPLSFAQQRLWFLEQTGLPGPAYHLPYVFHIRGRLDVEALERTLGELVRRHEILRTTFDDSEGRPRQLVAKPPAVTTLPRSYLSALPPEERVERARSLCMKDARRPFDLSRGPLWRARLLRLGEEEHVLSLTLHHIICDGWSIGLLYTELSALYSAFARGEESPLAELPIQYADFSIWQRRWLGEEGMRPQLDYWKRQLAGAPASLELPTDRPRPPVQTFKGEVHS